MSLKIDHVSLLACHPMKVQFPDFTSFGFSCREGLNPATVKVSLSSLSSPPIPQSIPYLLEVIAYHSKLPIEERSKLHEEIRATKHGAEGLAADMLHFLDIAGEFIRATETFTLRFRQLYGEHQLVLGITRSDDQARDSFQALIDTHDSAGKLSSTYMAFEFSLAKLRERKLPSSEFLESINENIAQFTDDLLRQQMLIGMFGSRERFNTMAARCARGQGAPHYQEVFNTFPLEKFFTDDAINIFAEYGALLGKIRIALTGYSLRDTTLMTLSEHALSTKEEARLLQFIGPAPKLKAA